MELLVGARLSPMVVSITKGVLEARCSSMVTTTTSSSLSLSNSQDIREEGRNNSTVMVDIIMKSRTFTDRKGDRETSNFCHHCLIFLLFGRY